MKWPESIERYRKYAEWECRDIPPDIVLSLIQHESRGIPGLAAKRSSKSKEFLPTESGGEHWTDRAMGLMQVVPGTILSYNDYQRSRKDFDPNRIATWEDMSGSDERSIRLQIATGCYYLAVANALIHKKLPIAAPFDNLSNATPNQIKLVLASYAVGAGATIDKLQALKSSGIDPTFENIRKHFPNWGKPNNRPIYYAQTVFKHLNSHTDNQYSEPKTLLHRGKTFAQFLLIPLAGVAVYLWRDQK